MIRKEKHTQSEATITNPCIRNCCLDSSDICIGCYRSLQEILAWPESTTRQKQKILQHCQKRMQQYKK